MFLRRLKRKDLIFVFLSLDLISILVYGFVLKNNSVITVKPLSANNSMLALSKRISRFIFAAEVKRGA
jgi:hypothetical protein